MPGLLDALGINKGANAQRELQRYQIDRQIAAELERQKLANQGGVDLVKQTGANEMTKAQWDALAAHAKTLGISPDAMKEMQPERFAIDRTRLKGAMIDAETGNEQARQNKADVNKGSELRGLVPLSPVRNPAMGANPASGNVMRSMIGATNSPMMGAMAQIQMAGQPQQIQADPQMLGAQRANEIMKARAFADTSARANSITTGPGSITSFPTIDGMQQQGGAIEQDTLTPDQFGMLHSQKTQNFPTFVPPSVWNNMPQTPPVGATGLNVNNASRGMSPLSQNQAADLDMQAAPTVNPMAMAAQGQTPQQNTMLSTLLAAIRAEINKKNTNSAPLFPGRMGGY